MVIAGYHVLETLGQGAGSAVYRVVDPSDDAIYALKHIKKEAAQDQRFVDQAINEHEVSMKIDSPLVRRTYKVHRVRSVIRMTELALVMEMVDGKTLEDAKPKRLRDMVRVFKVVARALDVMHHAGYAHADIKPINIMRTYEGGVKLIDLGQSCPLGTTKERIQGTPDYIAPEQVKLQPIMPQTDIYNLGATMFWCVTGHHVPSVLKSKTEGIGKRLDGMNTEFRNTDPRRYEADLPGALSSLISDCLERDPLRRPRDMHQVRARLNIALYQIDNADQANRRASEGSGMRPAIC
jgi:serine/threonine-protein kinase